MAAPTDDYLSAKHADTPAQRDACVRKLLKFAGRRGLGELAQHVCASYLAGSPQPNATRHVAAPPPIPAVFCPEQEQYLAVLEYAGFMGAAGHQAQQSLRFLAALAHPFANARVQNQLGTLHGPAPILHLDGIAATLDPGPDGVVPLLNALSERLTACVELAHDMMLDDDNPTALLGFVAVLDTLPLGARLVELVECVVAPQGRIIAKTLTAMHQAEREGHAMQADAYRAKAVWQCARGNLVGHAVLNALAAPLEPRLRTYFDNPRLMENDDDWRWAVRALFELRDLGRIAPTMGADLEAICYWTPDLLTISHYRALLTRCPATFAGTSRATFTMLRFLMRMEGPAGPLWTRPPDMVAVNPVGHHGCTCSSQKAHVAASIPDPGRPLVVRLDRQIEIIVHGEYVDHVGPFLRNAADEIGVGLQRIHKTDLEAGTWMHLPALFEDWKTQACIDGKLQVLGEYLVAHDMQEGPDPSCVLDLTGKNTLEDQVSEYLRVFREHALRDYAHRHHMSPHAVDIIERAPTFVPHYYNAAMFSRYLRSSDLCAQMSDEQIAALVDYQVDTLSVLERLP